MARQWYMLKDDATNEGISEFTYDADNPAESLPNKAGHSSVIAPWSGEERSMDWEWDTTTGTYIAYVPPDPSTLPPPDPPPPTLEERVEAMQDKLDKILDALDTEDDSGAGN